MSRGIKPALSIVIPCLGHAVELELCLAALERQDAHFAFEVIVVDSAADPKVEAVARRFPATRLVRSTRDLNAGAARNVGVQSATAKSLGFIDADCVPDAGWARAAMAAINNGAMLATGPILDLRPWHLISSTDNRLQFVDFPARRPPGLIEYCPGAHLVVAREAFDSQGGFPELSRHAHDVIFTTGIAKRWPERSRFSPAMRVRHYGREQWQAFLEHQRAFGDERAFQRLRMNRTLSWLGRRPGLAPLVAMRRMLYITARVLQWNSVDLIRYLVQMPFLLIGLWAWTRGFYKGMNNAQKPQE